MVPDSNATTLFIDSARVMARAGRKTAPSRSWECSPSRTTSPWRHSQGSSRAVGLLEAVGHLAAATLRRSVVEPPIAG